MKYANFFYSVNEKMLDQIKPELEVEKDNGREPF